MQIPARPMISSFNHNLFALLRFPVETGATTEPPRYLFSLLMLQFLS